MTGHTPTPWARSKYIRSYIVVAGHEDRPIGFHVDPEENAKIYASVIVCWPEGKGYRPTKEENQANFDYIFHAVNLHDELVAVCTLAAQAADCLPGFNMGIAELVEKARAVLAKLPSQGAAP